MSIFDHTSTQIPRPHAFTQIATHFSGSRAAAVLLMLLPIATLLGGCALGATAAASDPLNAPSYTAPSLETAPRRDNDTAITTDVVSQATADSIQAIHPAAPSSIITAPGAYIGTIEPVDDIAILTEVSGHVLEMPAREGDHVKVGQLLLRVSSTELEAQRAHAFADLQAAQAQVELLKMEISDADIEAARASVAAAEAAYQAALNGPTEEDLSRAQAQLLQAEVALRHAQAAYDQVAWNPLIATMPENLQLQQATLALEAAQAQYDKLVQGATEEVIAQTYAQLAQTRAQLQRLEEGPAAAQIQAANAQVRQAETALYLAQLQLEKATVYAPIDGIVAQVNLTVGAMALPGSPALHLISPEVKLVFPVEESHMAQLRVGQPARIQVTAYPGQSFDSTLTAIAPQLDPATRTVRVTVQPNDVNAPLTPGMFALVEINPE